MSLRTTFTYVVIPGINKNFSGVTGIFRSQWHIVFYNYIVLFLIHLSCYGYTYKNKERLFLL